MSISLHSTDRYSVPVLPLRGMVAFPSVPLSIEIARSKSIDAIRAAEQSDGYILLLAQKDLSVENPQADDLFAVGTVAKIKQSIKTSEGAVRVLLEGQSRAEVAAYTQDCSYIRAFAALQNTAEAEASVQSEALIRQAHAALTRVAKLMSKISDELVFAAQAISQPGLLADFIAVNFLFRYEDKQKILEIFDPQARLETTVALLRQEEEILHCEMDIHKKVRARLEENQRDAYLREQMRVIQGELGDDGADDADEFFDRIEKAALPKEIEEKLEKEAARLAKTPYGSAENSVLHNYLEECLDIPFGKYTEPVFDLEQASKILERDHDGLNEVKERILEFLAAQQFSGQKGGQILCLVGPPGVGKTSIAASIAEALGRKYVRVSLGGVRDEADIRGHRKTYVGAMPGRIVAALQKAGVMNPLILLDEIDKLTNDAHGDPASALLEVLDSEQNKSFRDHFTEIPIDLSECVFLATANTLDTVARPLIDRMEILHLDTYTRTEKLRIAKNHLIPKQLQKYGMTKKQCTITPSATAELIDYYTAEAGVRNLERTLAALCRKAAKELLGGAEKVTIRASDIPKYLGARKFLPEKLSPADEVGVVNGLAYTSVGGDILKIEAAVLDGSGKIEMTGSLGDVMRESAKLAVSYVRMIAKDYGINSDFYKTKDIHIHFPEGAVPKDGPSAGAAIVCALVSALSGAPVRRDVAMTGEFSLRGRLIAIGGLKEKTMAAYTSGIRTVLIPSDNVKDLEKIDQEARAHLNIIGCRSIQEILNHALAKTSAARRHTSARIQKAPEAARSAKAKHSGAHL